MRVAAGVEESMSELMLCVSENQVCAECTVSHIGMQLTMYCVTGIGLLKRIRCDSMLPMYASRCWRRGEHVGVDVV